MTNIEPFIPVNILTDYKQLKKNKILLKTFHDLCEKNKLEYWIICGTLLGAIRDKGIIPWDDDLDVSMKEEEVNKLLKIKHENLGIAKWFGGYKIYDLYGDKINGFEYKYPFIDIFIMETNINGDYVYKSEKAKKLWNDVYLIKDLYPLKKYQFEDFYVYGMNKPEQLLDISFPNWRKKGMKDYDHLHEKALEKISFQIDYDYNKKPYLWVYWENIKPAYIDLCYETIIKNCSNSFDVIKLDENIIKTYLPELNEYNKYFEKLRIAHKVDIYRIMLLYKYGGLYIDADTIVLRDPIEIMNKLRKYEYVGFGCTGNMCKYGYTRPSNGIMASRPNSILMGNILMKLLNKIKEIYDQNKYNDLEYFDLGKLVIWKEIEELIKNNEYEYYHYPNRFDGTRDINGNWITSKIIFSDINIKYEKEDELLFIVLYNSEINKDILNMSRDHLLAQNTNFSKYIKKSLLTKILI